MRIAVYGAGGVGGYFGGRLAQAGADVHLIARGAHLQALREQGLRVRSVTGDFEVRAPATDDPADVGSCDFVLFCVKTFDTDAATARLGPLVGEDTAVVSLQNGVENEETLARAVGDDHVMGGAAFIFAEIAEPGVIRHTGGPASITFGELDGRASERARAPRACSSPCARSAGSRTAAVMPACAQMKASLAHSTVLMSADSSAATPACSQQDSRRCARSLARPSSSPNVMLAGPPVCRITPGSAISAKMNAAPPITWP